MNNKVIGATGAILIALSSNAAAGDFSFSRVIPSWFSYSYAELDYVDMDDGFSGLSARVSFDVRPNWNIFGQYLFASSSKYDIDLDYRVVSVGGGYHYQLKNFKNSDLLFHAALQQGKNEWANQFHQKGDESDSGIRIGAKLRFEPQPDLEVNADISYNSLFNNDLTFTPAVLYNINQQFAVKGSFEFGDLDMLSIGVRYYIR